jgi:predicted DNA-binding transcriptional regulator YafY
MNRVDRLLALILHLQSRRVVTAEELAGHFELSVRTVYRDLNALGEAGVPIVAEAGVGYSLLRGYHLPPVMFTAAEAAAPRDNFDLQDHVVRMEDREPGVTIRIRIGDRGANRVRREWSLGLVTEEPTPDGVVFTLTAGRLEWFVNWLLSFGPWVTVLDPPGLRDQIVAAAEAAAAHHRGPPPVS